MADDSIEIVHEILAREIPEIATGKVEIKAVSREVGYRTKVGLQAVDRTVDPIRGRQVDSSIPVEVPCYQGPRSLPDLDEERRRAEEFRAPRQRNDRRDEADEQARGQSPSRTTRQKGIRPGL